MTTRTDNFNRANGAIGTPSDSGSAWVLLSGVWVVTSNEAADTGAGGGWDTVYLESSVTSINVQATIGSQSINGNRGGLIARVSDDNNYLLAYVVPGASGELRLFKNAVGFTQLGSTYTGSVVIGDVIKLTVDFSDNITLYQNGVSRVTATDSFNNTVTKHGLATRDVFSWDDFSITEIAAGGGVFGSNFYRQVAGLGGNF